MNGVAVGALERRRQFVERRLPCAVGEHDVDLGGASGAGCGEQRCQGDDGAHSGSCYSPNPLALKIDFASGVVSAPIIAFAASGCFALAVMPAE